MQMRGQGTEEYGGERKGRKGYAEDAKGNTKIIWKWLEPVFMRVAEQKWLETRIGAGCRYFAPLLGAGEYGGERRGRKSYAEVAKGNTKIIWKWLEPVFMRVAGHKWLGRRMGTGCWCFCGFCGCAWLGLE